LDDDPVTISTLFEETNEAEVSECCPYCGQGFDYRQLMAARHHRQPGHEPLALQ